MHVLITGANGFVGQALAARLERERALGGRAIDALTLIDIRFTTPATGLARQLVGSIANARFVSEALARPVDILFHLASIPGGMAEQNYALARDVNLVGTLSLLEATKAQTEEGGPVARFVFASSVAVYGAPLPERVDDQTALNPQMTYGAQKLIGEILVADFSRRHWIDGLSLRLPGVLARPPARTGQASAFLSDIIRELAGGHTFTAPMSPQATTWASSIHNIVENLLQGATVDASALPPHRGVMLPTLRFTMAEMVDAIAAVHGEHVRDLVRWVPDPQVEAWFGRFPPVTTESADAAGFRSDPDLRTLVQRAVEPL